MRLALGHRRAIVVGVHLLLIVLANYLAFLLRFDGSIDQRDWSLFLSMLPWLLAVRGLIFIPFRLYEGLWRYTSIWDLRNIIGAVLFSTTAFYVLVHLLLGHTTYPRSVFIIDSILLVFFLGGVRLLKRVYRELGHLEGAKRILVYGAGDAGEMIVRDLKQNPSCAYEPIGFIDDDPSKVGHRIHGVKVLGTRDSLTQVIEQADPDAVVVAMPSSPPSTIRRIVKALEPFNVMIKTLPNFRDLQDATVSVSQIRNLSIEDLLERTPIGLDPAPIRQLLSGKRVMITGAGGSIGSELCRQVLSHGPDQLVLYERYENSLYSIAGELAAKARELEVPVDPVIGDVSDATRVEEVLAEHRPQIIFHAAAHKHVPLMELCPCEAVKNNVAGTRVVAEAAHRSGVERFILISTDKAVTPTSVMGATKRVAELMIQTMAQSWTGVFSAVRFGNVLGSNGSAVPHFIEQIKAGGPVTVTHPEMRRFFMLIPEATQLVLHAAALARGGEIFVLEMGEQIKVLDMVHNLIRLSGLSPEDVPIQIIGTRPGEKLYEELVGEDEAAERSEIKEIFRVKPRLKAKPIVLVQRIRALGELARQGDAEGVIKLLQEIVPSYSPSTEGWKKAVGGNGKSG